MASIIYAVDQHRPPVSVFVKTYKLHYHPNGSLITALGSKFRIRSPSGTFNAASLDGVDNLRYIPTDDISPHLCTDLCGMLHN